MNFGQASNHRLESIPATMADLRSTTFPRKRKGLAVTTSHTIPDTQAGRFFRGVLLVVGISSIVGIADQVRALFWLVLAGPSIGGPGAGRLLIMLAGWGILCWCGVRAYRKNALPPTWAAVALALLIWARILWPG